MDGLTLVFLYPAVLIVAAFGDILSLRIPNWLSLTLVVWFVVFGVFAGLTMGVMALRLGLGAAVFLSGFVIYNFGLIGGGDVKLIAGSAIWVGWPDLGIFLLLVAICGGGLAGVVLIIRKMHVPVPVWISEKQWYVRLTAEGEGIPYGVAICIAGLLTFPTTLAGLTNG